MSQENVEVVRAAWSAYSKQGIDAYVDHVGRTAFVRTFRVSPTAGPIEARRGRGRGNGTSGRPGTIGPGNWRRSSMRATASWSR